MNVIKETIMDWKHWLGWIMSALAIWIMFYYLMTKTSIEGILAFIILVVTIVIVDLIKHVTKLQ